MILYLIYHQIGECLKGYGLCIGMQALAILSLFVAFGIDSFYNELDLPKGMLFVVLLGMAALPLQFVSIFYGVSMAIHETRNVVFYMRKWFLFITLFPVIFVAGLCLMGLVLDAIY